MPNQPTKSIVDLLRHAIYHRIDTRNGGALAKASEGKTLIVTGASEGIGRSIAIIQAHTHPQCIILTDRLTAPLDAVAAELAAIDSEIRVIRASVDVSDYTAVGAFFAHLRQVENIGRIDVLFNTAGYLEELSTCAKTISNNIIGVANATNEFLRHNFAAAGGNPDGTTEHKNKQALKDTTVIIASSSGALDARPGLSAYSSSKMLVNRFCEFLDIEYGIGSPFGADGLRTFCFHPGDIPTDLSQHLPQEYLANGRAGGHDSLDLSGGFTAWLLTPEADFLRGRYANATWDVDGLLAKKQDILERDLLKCRVNRI